MLLEKVDQPAVMLNACRYRMLTAVDDEQDPRFLMNASRTAKGFRMISLSPSESSVDGTAVGRVN